MLCRRAGVQVETSGVAIRSVGRCRVFLRPNVPFATFERKSGIFRTLLAHPPPPLLPELAARGGGSKKRQVYNALVKSLKGSRRCVLATKAGFVISHMRARLEARFSETFYPFPCPLVRPFVSSCPPEARRSIIGRFRLTKSGSQTKRPSVKRNLSVWREIGSFTSSQLSHGYIFRPFTPLGGPFLYTVPFFAVHAKLRHTSCSLSQTEPKV